MDSKLFCKILLNWASKNTRNLPWKQTQNPYKIWLSEVILQQTRVAQGLPYYNKFIAKYPSIQHLAAAPLQDVYKLWQGLGYYSRANNMHLTAKLLVENYHSKFPENYDELLKLRGIGHYTAAAIASFAFKLPHAVLDGNVYRVLSRIYGITTAIDLPIAKKEFTVLANELIDKKKPDVFNQAIMDYGATVCKPLQPLCTECGFNKYCIAFYNNTVNELPVKAKKLKIKDRIFYYLVLKYKGHYFIHKRQEKDVWQGLYQFPMIESNSAIPENKFLKLAQEQFNLDTNVKLHETFRVTQKLTHQRITAYFYEIDILKIPVIIKNNYIKVSEKELHNYPFPKIMQDYISKNIL